MISFAERAFYNPFYLGYLYPSNCDLIEIAGAEDTSVLQTLTNPTQNFYANKPVRVHKAAKAVRGAARLAYGVVALAIFCPIGAAYHGTKMGQHLVRWVRSEDKPDWELAKEYAKVFFIDLGATGLGVSCVVRLVFSAYLLPGEYLAGLGVSEIVGTLIFHGFAVWGTLNLSGTIDTHRFIPWVTAWGDRAQGRLVALSVGNQLGAVGPGGSVLRYGQEDRVEYTSLSENPWKNKDYFVKMAENALYEYFTAVEKFGLSERNVASDRDYIKILEESLRTDQIDELRTEQLEELRRLWDNAQFIWKLFQWCQERALYGGVFRTMMERIFFRERYSFSPLPSMGPMLLPRIRASRDISSKDLSSRYNSLFQNAKISELDPATPPSEDGTAFVHTRNLIATALWKARRQSNQMTPLADLLGLKENYSINDLRAAWRAIERSAQPGSADALDVMRDIYTVLMEPYERK